MVTVPGTMLSTHKYYLLLLLSEDYCKDPIRKCMLKGFVKP